MKFASPDADNVVFLCSMHEMMENLSNIGQFLKFVINVCPTRQRLDGAIGEITHVILQILNVL